MFKFGHESAAGNVSDAMSAPRKSAKIITKSASARRKHRADRQLQAIQGNPTWLDRLFRTTEDDTTEAQNIGRMFDEEDQAAEPPPAVTVAPVHKPKQKPRVIPNEWQQDPEVARDLKRRMLAQRGQMAPRRRPGALQLFNQHGNGRVPVQHERHQGYKQIGLEANGKPFARYAY